jgi:hypothetical protein
MECFCAQRGGLSAGGCARRLLRRRASAGHKGDRCMATREAQAGAKATEPTKGDSGDAAAGGGPPPRRARENVEGPLNRRS